VNGSVDEGGSRRRSAVGSFLTQARARVSNQGHLARGSMWQLAAKGVIAVAGFTFWAIAARIHPQQIVGRGMGLYTCVTLLTFLTGAGLSFAVSRYATGDDRDSATLFTWAVIATSITTLIGALGTVVFARSFLLTKMSWLGWAPTILILFVFVNGISVGLLQEIRLIGRRRPELVFIRAVAIGFLPIPVLWFLRNNSEPGVWIAGSLCGGIALVVVAGMFFWRRELGPYRVLPKPANAGAAMQFSLISMATHMVMSAPFYLVPFVVLTQTSGAEYAVFYFSWNVLSIILLIPGTIAGVLLIEGDRSDGAVDKQTSMALFASIGAVIAALICLIPVSWAMALVLGRDYRYIVVLIPLLVISGVPWSISYVLISHSRIHEHTRVTWVISAVVFVGSLGTLVPLISMWGTFGAAIAWLFGNTLAAVVAVLVTSWDRTDSVVTLRALSNRLRKKQGLSNSSAFGDGIASAPVAQVDASEVLGQ